MCYGVSNHCLCVYVFCSYIITSVCVHVLQRSGVSPKVTTLAYKWALGATVDEDMRDFLGEEMIDMCAGLPVYALRRMTDKTTVTDLNGEIIDYTGRLCAVTCPMCSIYLIYNHRVTYPQMEQILLIQADLYNHRVTWPQMDQTLLI